MADGFGMQARVAGERFQIDQQTRDRRRHDRRIE